MALQGEQKGAKHKALRITQRVRVPFWKFAKKNNMRKTSPFPVFAANPNSLESVGEADHSPQREDWTQTIAELVSQFESSDCVEC